MGNQLSALVSRILFKTRKCKVAVLGLDGAGKTTLMNSLTKPLVNSRNTAPTMGPEIHTKKIGNVSFELYDIGGGGEKVRALWIHYLEDCAGVVFVVDSTDDDRLMHISRLVEKNSNYPSTKNKPILVLANKQDSADALSAEDVEQKMGLHETLGPNRPWKCMSVSGLRKDGVLEAFTWFSKAISSPKIHPESKYRVEKESSSLVLKSPEPVKNKILEV